MPRAERRRWLRAGAVVLAAALLAEGALRLAGWGGPSLVQGHAQIGYLPKPASVHERLGARISFNAASMRAHPVPPPGGGIARVLVIGDSVIAGGFSDDRAVPTAHAEAILAASHGPAWIGAVAAGGWGPANQLAYLEAFGTFDADAAVLVLNATDPVAPAAVAPDGGPLTPDRHRLAIEEALTLGLLPRIAPRPFAEPDGPPSLTGIGPIAAILDRLAADAVPVAILYHPLAPGHERLDAAMRSAIEAVAAPRGIAVTDLAPIYAPLGPGSYLDAIHPDQAAQAALGAAIAVAAGALLDPGGGG